MLSASKIYIKRSHTPGSSPTISDLEYGELAINLADKKIFFRDTADQIAYFEISPYSFLQALSSVLVIEGNNTVTGVFSQVLGGYNNDVSGSGSSVINGENNDIEGDFAFIGNGLNNLILSSADFGAILGGQNNTLGHADSFILGSDIVSHADNFTYVNNISATGKIYGDGSELEGIVAGDSEATTLVRSNSALWQGTYTTVLANSASWESAPINVILNSDPLKFVFIGDGSTTSYTVSGTAGSENPSLIEVFVDNVRQEPVVSYTLSSEIVEFTEAPVLSSRIVIITPNVVEGQGGGGSNSGAVGTKTIAFFTALNNEPPATNFATLDTINSHPVLDFDTTTQESAIFRNIIPEGVSLLSGCNVIAQWGASSATSGTIGWDVSFERITSNGINLSGDNFGTAQTITALTVPSTAGIILTSSCSFTQAQLPSGLTNGDMYRLRIRRDVASDTASGDAELLGVEVRLV